MIWVVVERPEEEGFQTINVDGVTILIHDNDSTLLNGLKLDFKDSLMGGGFAHGQSKRGQGMWLRAIIWLNCLIGGCAMIPPLANIVEIPTAVTLVSGKDSRNHLNRMLTVDNNDSNLTRKRIFYLRPKWSDCNLPIACGFR